MNNVTTSELPIIVLILYLYCEILVTAHRHLPRVTIDSSQETSEVAAAVVLSVLVVVTEATMGVHMEDLMAGHLGRTGGAIDCQSTECTVL